MGINQSKEWKVRTRQCVLSSKLPLLVSHLWFLTSPATYQSCMFNKLFGPQYLNFPSASGSHWWIQHISTQFLTIGSQLIPRIVINLFDVQDISDCSVDCRNPSTLSAKYSCWYPLLQWVHPYHGWSDSILRLGRGCPCRQNLFCRN